MYKIPVDNFIFDLDGTLVDSIGDIAYSLQIAYQNLGLIYNPDLLVIGPPLEDIIEILTPSVSEKQKQNIIAEFRKHYLYSDFSRTIPYQGVVEVLKTLQSQGKRLFIATNKPKNGSKMLLNALDLNYFEFVGTPDYIEGQLMTKTEVIKYIVANYHLDPNKTLMVGDTHPDIIAGKNNQLLTLAFTGGYGEKEKIALEEPILSIHEFKEILNKTK
ncbi:MAG: HAD family hydrolase [Bacteroidales bacterium]